MIEQSANPTVQQLFDLSGKTVLITGASGYLGSAMATALAEAGANVIASSRDLSRAESAVGSLPGSGSHAAVVIDHMDEASIDLGFEQALQIGNPIDVLVNNGHEPIKDDWTSVSGEQFARQLNNATGYFLLARKMRDHLFQRDAAGCIVLVGSMYGLVASYPRAYEDVCPASPVAYHTLKGGIVHMTRHLAAYWAQDRVRVNCLSPGPFPSKKAPPQLVERLCRESPMKRMGQPFELKGAIVFLASDASGYMTGQNLVIDGGWTAW